MENGLADITICSVCLEEYDENARCPRILPCSHTQCERCLAALLIQNEVEEGPFRCPECRQEHPLTNPGVHNFQQNKYILAHLKSLTKKKRENSEVCSDHMRPLLLYCSEPSCLEPICHLCFMKGEHVGHRVIDIKEYAESRKDDAMRQLDEVDFELKKYSDALDFRQLTLDLNAKLGCKRLDDIGNVIKQVVDDQIAQLKADIGANCEGETKRIEEGVEKSNKCRRKLKLLSRRLQQFHDGEASRISGISQQFKTEIGSAGLDDMFIRIVSLSEIAQEPVREKVKNLIASTLPLRISTNKVSRVRDFTQQQPPYARETNREWQVFLKTPRGKTRVVAVDPTDTVGLLKRKIEQLEGIPPEHLRIKRFCGPPLVDDNLSLRDCGVHDNSNLVLSTWKV